MSRHTFRFTEQYWSKVVDALTCVLDYIALGNTSQSDQIRYQEFPERVNAARAAYYDCDPLPLASFEMVGDDIDEFFHRMVMDKKHLQNCFDRVLTSFINGDEAVPMRLL